MLKREASLCVLARGPSAQRKTIRYTRTAKPAARTIHDNNVNDTLRSPMTKRDNTRNDCRLVPWGVPFPPRYPGQASPAITLKGARSARSLITTILITVIGDRLALPGAYRTRWSERWLTIGASSGIAGSSRSWSSLVAR